MASRGRCQSALKMYPLCSRPGKQMLDGWQIGSSATKTRASASCCARKKGEYVAGGGLRVASRQEGSEAVRMRV